MRTWEFQNFRPSPNLVPRASKRRSPWYEVDPPLDFPEPRFFVTVPWNFQAISKNCPWKCIICYPLSWNFQAISKNCTWKCIICYPLSWNFWAIWETACPGYGLWYDLPYLHFHSAMQVSCIVVRHALSKF